MTPEQFTYWLQGKLEGRDITQLGADELNIIQEHLNTVFHKVTPKRDIHIAPNTPQPQKNFPYGYEVIC